MGLEGARQSRRAWKETGRKTGCREEENRSVPSLDSEWVCVGRTGFLWALERRLEREGGQQVEHLKTYDECLSQGPVRGTLIQGGVS